MRVDIANSIADIRQSDWNALAGNEYPFLRHEFLLAAERSGCVSPDSGWVARHITIRDGAGRLRAAMPLYEKSHSWGEFVFDWAWARAYQQAGIEYYPKLVSAAPFTPASCRKLLLANNDDVATAELLLHSAIDLALDSGCSSLHVQFPTADELPLLQAAGLKSRKDCQFHWQNRDFTSFDEFLQSFSAAKRKKAKRDRRHVAERGITFRWLKGREIKASDWERIYQLISYTFLRRNSLPYYNYEFFCELSRTMPDNIVSVVAELHGEIIAAAIFYESPNTLYGRYWGCSSQHNALHFETCYYQGIDYCIANKLQTFEPGTQGEHKISRGFLPVATWSAHWLRRPEFFSAVGQYLDEEKRHIDRYIDAASQHSPYKRNPD